jgi:hypothetical protein
MPTPQEVVQAFKTQGHFDALRKDILEAFQSSPKGQALERAITRVLEGEHEAVLAFQSKARIQGQDHMELVRLQSTLRKRVETYVCLSIPSLVHTVAFQMIDKLQVRGSGHSLVISLIPIFPRL